MGEAETEMVAEVVVDSVTIIILLDSLDLPDSIVGYETWKFQYGPYPPVLTLDQIAYWGRKPDTAFMAVGVWNENLQDYFREQEYRGSPGSDTLFVGRAPARDDYYGAVVDRLPDTLDLQWLCFGGSSIALFTSEGDTVYATIGTYYSPGPNDLLGTYVNDRANYPWWRPFVLTDDTLILEVGLRLSVDTMIFQGDTSIIHEFKLGCLGSQPDEQPLYFRIAHGGQEVSRP